MQKKSLRDTNPYLKDHAKQQEMIALSVSSSSAIEGIRVSSQEILDWQRSTVKAPRRGRRSAG